MIIEKTRGQIKTYHKQNNNSLMPKRALEDCKILLLKICRCNWRWWKRSFKTIPYPDWNTTNSPETNVTCYPITCKHCNEIDRKTIKSTCMKLKQIFVFRQVCRSWTYSTDSKEILNYSVEVMQTGTATRMTKKNQPLSSN